MTLPAITYVMAIGEGKEVMIDICGSPCKPEKRMAFRTILRVSPLYMVWFGGSLVIFCMAVVTFNSLGLEPEQGSRGMTAGAVGRIMRTYQRKSAFLMHFGNILDDP